MDSSWTGGFLSHRVVVWGRLWPGEENLRLVPVQSTGPTGEKDGRESGEILQLLRQHVQDGLQAASQEGRRYAHTLTHTNTHKHTLTHTPSCFVWWFYSLNKFDYENSQSSKLCMKHKSKFSSVAADLMSLVWIWFLGNITDPCWWEAFIVYLQFSGFIKLIIIN